MFEELRRHGGFALGAMRGRPFQVLLQLTNRCNMRCDFCDFWPNGVPQSEELSFEDYRWLGQELTRLGRFLISIEGGEPFVRPDLVDIVRLLSVRHVTALFTNGWFVTDDNAQALFEAGLASVSVSIDYVDSTRHDQRRGLVGASERAWRAVDRLRNAAPAGGRQVNVITVLMEDNHDELEGLLAMSAAHGVGHQVTLVATSGFRRGDGSALPPAGAGAELVALWHRHPHLRALRGYLEGIHAFLDGAPLPECQAGVQSFNIDHVGNVSPCIEHIDAIVGNVREEPLTSIHRRLRAVHPRVRGCQDCWTLCRGLSQLLGSGGSVTAWRDTVTRLRSL